MGGNTVPPPGPTVYIAGDNGTNPILWKNGVPDTLSQTTGTAYQVFLTGSDIYVAGVSQETGMPGLFMGQYGYWKNGTPNNIGNLGTAAYPISIAISGSDMYAATTYAGWKNGVMQTFPGIASDSAFFKGNVKTTFASGSDIYFAGTDSLQNAVEWKNGVSQVVAPYNGRGSTLPLVSCMYVSGSDVYVGGMYDRGVYWKNGVANFMQARPNDASFVGNINSIFVNGTDVYTTGILTPIGLPAGEYPGAYYWKNGIEQDLQLNNPPNASTLYATTSVFVSGTDVYVAGYSITIVSPTATPIDSAVYWKNGQEISLSSPGIAHSIYFQ